MTRDRRELLTNGIQVACSLSLAAFFEERFLGAGGPALAGLPVERTLVVVQLSGGNDGLNTLVPHRQDTYFRLRPTLALPKGKLHALDDDFGLHPSMGALAELHHEGKLATLHGVGYPEPDRSHFRSMEIWHTADPKTRKRDRGWLGRFCDRFGEDPSGIGLRGSSMRGIHVGGVEVPLALRGRDNHPTAVTDARGMRLRELSGLERPRNRLVSVSPHEPDATRRLREVARQSYDVAERLGDAFESEKANEAPGHGLARRLQLVSSLISAGFGLRVFHLELGGFDTHARQARVHEALLRELSESLAFFQRDLAAKSLSDKVTTFVFSEFGRRAAENGSKGTDHGAAAPVFLMGDNVLPGLHGTPPDLGLLQDGDVPCTSDFRSVYASLEEWMGLGASFAREPVEVLRKS